VSALDKKRVLVLCHGNIMRSPIAAALLERSGLFRVRQAGLNQNMKEGKPTAKKCRDAANSLYGLDLSDHRSRKVTSDDLQWADIIFFMDNGNEKRLDYAMKQALCHTSQSLTRVYRLSDWQTPGKHIPQIKKVTDPAWLKKDSEEFWWVMRFIGECCENYIAMCKNLTQEAE